MIISADTSYSNNTKWVVDGGAKAKAKVVGAGGKNTAASLADGNGTRGGAVSEVIFYMEDGERTVSTRLHGVLSNGAAYDYRLESGSGLAHS